MRTRVFSVASLLLSASLPVLGQNAVPVWEDLYRPAAPPPVNASAIASRELADGTILVVTDRFVCAHFAHDGTPLFSVQLPISRRAGGGNGAGPQGARPSSPEVTAPLPAGAAYAAIDPFGRVVVSFVSDPGFFFPIITGDIETNKFDGLTGQALWPSPQIYGHPYIGEYPTGVFLDRNGDVIVTGLTGGGGSSHITIKYRGSSGEVIWGPQLILAAIGSATLNFYGDVLVTLGRFTPAGFGWSTLRYSATDGSIIWGPVDFNLPESTVPTVGVLTPDGRYVVAGYSASPRQLVLNAYSADSGAVAWGPVMIDPPAGTSTIFPTSAVADLLGNVVLTVRYETSSTASYATMKLEGRTGTVLWGPIPTEDGSQGSLPEVAIFGNGDVLLRALTGGRLSFWRYRGSDGAPLWGPTDFGTSSDGYPVSYFTSQILSDGHVFGSAIIDPDGTSVFGMDGSSGTPLFGPTPFAVPVDGFVYFDDMSTGPDGSPVSIGDTYSDLRTIKYDRATGAVLWGPIVYAPGGAIRGWQVLVDGNNDAIVMGSSDADGLFLIKYSGATGAKLWGPTSFPTMASVRLGLDAAGNALVLGYTASQDTGYDSAVAKVSGATGAVLWGPVTYDSSGDFQATDLPVALAADASGDVYVAGDSESPKTGISWFVLKYSGADGSLVWGPAGSDVAGRPAAVATGSGKVVVTGSGAVGDFGGMTTVAYDAPTGSVAWGPHILKGTDPYIDSGVDLQIDGAGNVFASGTLYNVPQQADIATIKYRGSDGAVLWGPALFDCNGLGDYAYILGLGLDASGNVVVGGTSYRTPHNSDIVLLKYDGATGAMLWGPAYEGGIGEEYLYGFGVSGASVAVGANSEGGMLTAVYDESFGIATPAAAVSAAFCGSPYTFAFEARNGVTPYAWSLASGSLPPGLTLSSNGILSGTPSEQGTFTFRVEAEDSAAGSVQRDFTIVVLEGPSPYYLNVSLDGACQYTLSVSGSWESILWLPGGETTSTISVSPLETTTYGAVVDSGTGCVYHLSTTIVATMLQDASCSAPVISSITPGHGPAGGTPVEIFGGNFQSGVVVTIGGAAALNVVVVDSVHITATTPARPAGSFSDVVVVNPDTGNAALLGGFYADFDDVPTSDLFYGYVKTLVKNKVTAGCGGGNYCPASPATRAQMAVFLLKSLYGPSYVPPSAIGIFDDVPAGDPFAPWIEALWALGVTAGCGGNDYCPADDVTRAQMAAFLLKTRNGSSYAPPPAVGIFDDVPASDPFAPWIEQIYSEAITGGCSAAPLLYCPGASVTRGQMAAFLVKTFQMQ
jgi:hypothetical protein